MVVQESARVAGCFTHQPYALSLCGCVLLLPTLSLSPSRISRPPCNPTFSPLFPLHLFCSFLFFLYTFFHHRSIDPMKPILSLDFLTPPDRNDKVIRQWMQSTLDIQLPSACGLHTSLRDGVYLCKSVKYTSVRVWWRYGDINKEQEQPGHMRERGTISYTHLIHHHDDPGNSPAAITINIGSWNIYDQQVQ